jgi:hypothetical protein
MELAEQIRRIDRIEDALKALVIQQEKFFANMDKRQELQEKRNEEQDRRHEETHIKHLELYAENKVKHNEIQWIKKVFWVAIISFVGIISSSAGAAYHLNGKMEAIEKSHDVAIRELQISDATQKQMLQNIIEFLSKKNEKLIK